MKNYLLLAAMLLLSMSVSGQNYKIIGSVVDSTNANLSSATVVALSELDSSIVSFALSDNKGEFVLENISEGDILIQISYLGYNQLNKNISIDGSKEIYDVGALSMSSSLNQLEQVVVKGEHVPLMIKKDTVEYNAAAFQTQPNEVVEDLLKKMPGIEVDDDGTITAQGEEVEQVLVDGKEFFGNDPKIATQNLPAAAVDKVQVYDKKSDMAEFNGIDDGERQKTMNLELKEEYKEGYFGNLMAGYGLDDNEQGRYEGRFSLNRFSPKLQLSSIGNLNNVNKQGFSMDQYISMMSSSGGFGRGRNSNINIQDGLSNGYVDTGAGGINMNYDISKKTELNVSYFVNDIASSLNQITTRENLIGNGNNYFSVDSGLYKTNNTSHAISSKLEHEIDSTQNIEMRFTYNRSNPILDNNSVSETFESPGIFSNRVSNDISSESLSPVYSWDANAMYKKKFGKRSFSINGYYANGLEHIIGTQISQDFLIPQKSFDYNLSSLDDNHSYRLRGSYVEPIGIGKHLELNYRHQNYQNHYENLVNENIIPDLDLIDTLSNFYERDYVYDRAGLAYHFSDDASSFSLEGAIQFSNLKGDIFDPATSGNDLVDNISFTNKAFLPRATYRYEFDRGHSIRVNYSTSVREPSLEQLQPRTDVSDPLNLFIGNENLIPEYRHSARINYFKWDQFTFRSFFAFINATYTRNKITNQTIISDRFVETTSPLNVKDDLSVRGSLSYSSPIRKLGLKYRLRSNLVYNNQIVFINGIQNDANRYTTTLSLTLENRKKEKFDAELGYRSSYNLNSYSEVGNNDQTTFNQRVNADLAVTALKNWIFESGININFYNQQNFGDQQTIPIWTASISRLFKEGQNGELKIAAFDLLNKNIGISRTSTANYIQNQEINSLARYFLVSYLYTLKGFGGEGNRPGGRRGNTRFMRM